MARPLREELVFFAAFLTWLTRPMRQASAHPGLQRSYGCCSISDNFWEPTYLGNRSLVSRSQHTYASDHQFLGANIPRQQIISFWEPTYLGNRSLVSGSQHTQATDHQFLGANIPRQQIISFQEPTFISYFRTVRPDSAPFPNPRYKCTFGDIGNLDEYSFKILSYSINV